MLEQVPDTQGALRSPYLTAAPPETPGFPFSQAWWTGEEVQS